MTLRSSPSSEDGRDAFVGPTILLCILLCCCTAALLEPVPLSDRAKDLWRGIVRAQIAGRHQTNRTYFIDSITTPGASARNGKPFQVLPGESVTVRGWALDPSTLQTAVAMQCRVDNGLWQAIGYHQPRPDVPVYFGLPGAPDSGFTAVVESRGLRAGQHVIEFDTLNERDVRAPIRERIVFTVARPR